MYHFCYNSNIFWVIDRDIDFKLSLSQYSMFKRFGFIDVKFCILKSAIILSSIQYLEL